MLPAPRSSLTVVQLLPALESGGVERGTLEIAEALVVRGHRSIVISAGGRLVDTLERAGSEHLAWPVGRKSPRTLWLVHRLRRFLWKERVDILHARSRVPAWLGWLAWKSLPPAVRPRFVTTVHGANSVNAYSAIMTRGEAVIAVSETIRDYVRDNYPNTPMEKVRVIHRGRDPREFPHGHQPSAEWLARWQEQFPELHGKLLITLPGRIARLKGHHDFITLVERLRDRGFDAHGLIVGGAEPGKEAYLTEVQSFVSQRGLSRHITFTGHRGDLKEIYAISRVVCSLTTQPESFGRTTLEALSIGTPAVGYSHGGVGEILSRVYPTGRVEPFNIPALIDRVAAILMRPKSLVPPFADFLLHDMQRQEMELYEELAGMMTAVRLPLAA
jgi:glycosyltransferase involved in cell wall biosynthesis